MKRIYYVFTFLLIAFSLVFNVSFANEKVEYKSFVLDGKEVKLPITRVMLGGIELNGDVPPLILNNRTLVPVRLVSESLGATVTWDSKEYKVNIKKDNKDITLKIDSYKADVNKEEYILPDNVPAKIINNRTMVPVRFVSEQLGVNVDWDAKNRVVLLKNKEVEIPENMIVKYNIGMEPRTLDPALNTSIGGGTILNNCYEGLMRLDENDQAIPGMAESYKVSEDGLIYTFYLRDAKWSDGKKVTAYDFEYSWKRALDPELGAMYAFQLYYIKNGMDFNYGEISADEVGVKAIDEKTLEVKLESPNPYFLGLTTFPTYFPVRKDVVEKNPETWSLNPDTHISNGPFKIVKWERNDFIKIIKNENYYDKDRVNLDIVEFTMIPEDTIALAAFESGEIDGLDQVPINEIQRLQKESNEFNLYPYLGTYYYTFNISKEPFNNPKVRKALSLAIDRKTIVEDVVKGGQIPALSFVPLGMKEGNGTEFSENAKKRNYGIKETAQVEEAKKLLAEAGYPNGKGFPEIILNYNTNQMHKEIAQSIQLMWKQNLGVEVKLQSQEWKIFQETKSQGDYAIARDGWIGDYIDPMTFLDMFISTSGNNYSRWENYEFDKLIEDIQVTQDTNKRYELMHKAEDLIMEDMIVIPIYYYTNPEMIKSYVKDVRVSPLGFVSFDEAYIKKIN